MKRFIKILILLFSVAQKSSSQVIINAQLPSPGVYTKSQLWNLSVINSTTNTYNAQLVVTLSDLQSNQLVLTGTSRFFTLSPGALQLTTSILGPISYQVLSANYPIDPQPEGFLPVGQFTTCYTLYWQNRDALDPLVEQCELLEIDPLSPPQLILPEDRQTSGEVLPFFTWSAPMSTTLFTNVKYDFKLVELLPFQSPSDAIQQNIPVWMEGKLINNSFQYTVSQPKLDSSKTYAWQITAMNNLAPISSSEIWTFKVGGRSTTVDRNPKGTYAELKRTPSGAFIIIDGDIQFVYDNPGNVPLVNVEIYEFKNGRRIRATNSSISFPLKVGRNYLRVPAKAIVGFNNNGKYILEVTGSEKSYLKFQRAPRKRANQ